MGRGLLDHHLRKWKAISIRTLAVPYAVSLSISIDDVGWPWPKHPCTDKYKGNDAGISRANSGRLRFHLRGQDGKPREVYEAVRIVTEEQGLRVKLKKVSAAKEFWVTISNAELSKHGVVKSDIHEAPTIVTLEHDDRRIEFGFLCGRLQSAVTLTANKTEAPKNSRK
jgi:hypothetical protein